MSLAIITCGSGELLCGVLANIMRHFLDRLTARLDGQLRPAGPLQIVHQNKCLGDCPAYGEQTVVSQNKNTRRLTEILNYSLSLIEVERDPFKIMVRDTTIELKAPLVTRLEPFFQRRYRHSADSMRVDDACRIVTCVVDSAVNRKTSRVHVEFRRFHLVSVSVYLDQLRRCHLCELKAKWID